VANETVERREVCYSGRVQGVGFRYTTQGIAAMFPIAGYVRNLPDGRVQLVVEGTTQIVAEFLRAIDEELGRYIVRTEQQSLPATGELTAFRIRH